MALNKVQDPRSYKVSKPREMGSGIEYDKKRIVEAMEETQIAFSTIRDNLVEHKIPLGNINSLHTAYAEKLLELYQELCDD